MGDDEPDNKTVSRKKSPLKKMGKKTSSSEDSSSSDEDETPAKKVVETKKPNGIANGKKEESSSEDSSSDEETDKKEPAKTVVVTNGKRKREKSEESSESVSTTEKSNKKSRLLNPDYLNNSQNGNEEVADSNKKTPKILHFVITHSMNLTLGAPKPVKISLLHKARVFDMRKLRKNGEVIVGAKLTLV